MKVLARPGPSGAVPHHAPPRSCAAGPAVGRHQHRCAASSAASSSSRTPGSAPGSVCSGEGRPLEVALGSSSRSSSSGREVSSSSSSQHAPAVVAAASMALALAFPGVSHAIIPLNEPANALSVPTWAIHVSSVVEWATAMGLFWQYAEVSGNPRWKGMSWAMLPCFGSAMAACTWHFFYNAPELEYLVALQAFLTLLGNTTIMLAAIRIWSAARAEAKNLS